MNPLHRHIAVFFGVAILVPRVHGIAKILLGIAFCLYGIMALIETTKQEEK